MYPKWPKFSDSEAQQVKDVLLSGKINYWTGQMCTSFENKFASSVISFSNQVRCTPGGRLDMSHKFLIVSSTIEVGQITRPTGSNLGSSLFIHF